MSTLKPRTIATGVGRTEGPVIRSNGEIIVTSMNQGRLYAIADGKATVFSELGHTPNGAVEWSDGVIYVAQNGGHRFGPGHGKGGIQAVKTDGTWTWLTQEMIAPNDLCFGPDNFLYVTDPTRPRPERDDGRLFRCDIKTGEAELLCSLPWYPNGIGFGLEDDVLYVVNSRERAIMRLPFASGGKLGKPEKYVQQPEGHRADGFTFDVSGNIIIGANSLTDAPGQVQTFDRNGKLVDVYEPGPGKMCTNVALSPERMLVVTTTDTDNVVAVDNWPQAGLLLHPFR